MEDRLAVVEVRVDGGGGDPDAASDGTQGDRALVAGGLEQVGGRGDDLLA